MESFPLITVIIPVYNIEDYIERCVQSVRRQTYQNLEILLVDDGSRDQSAELCDHLAQQDSRITTLHKENGGLSDARNYGIEHAHGDYLTFLDGDDWLDEDCIIRLYQAIIRDDCDFSQCRYRYAYDDHFEEWTIDQPDYKVYEGKELQLSFIESGSQGITVVAWGKLYKREIFSGIRYPKGKVHEDVFTMCDIAFGRPIKAAVINEVLVNYYQRSGSISQTVSFPRLQDQLDSQLYVSQHAAQDTPELKVQADRMLYEVIISIVNSIPYDQVDAHKNFLRNIEKACRRISMKSLKEYGYRFRLRVYFLLLRSDCALYLKLRKGR